MSIAEALKNLYIANHAYRIEGRTVENSTGDIKMLLDHTSQPKYCCEVEWENPTDLGKCFRSVRARLTSAQSSGTTLARCEISLTLGEAPLIFRHRATLGEFDGKYKRDMRRTTVHDDSAQAWGLNNVGDTWRSGLP